MAAFHKKPLPNDMGSSGDVQRYGAYCDMDYRTIVEGMVCIARLLSVVCLIPFV